MIILILIPDVFHSQVTIEGLCQHYGLNQSEAVSVIYKAVKIARDACLFLLSVLEPQAFLAL